MATNPTQSSSEELTAHSLSKAYYEAINVYPPAIQDFAGFQAIERIFTSHLQAYTDEIRREVISIGYEPPSAYAMVSRAIRENLRKKQRQALNNLATKWGVK